MKLFTIFGNPVSHSISPLIHNHTIKSLGIDACYTRTLLKDGYLIKNKFHTMKLNGANITVPFKEDAFMICDDIRGIAKDIGAVNTIIKKNDKLVGFNTDAPGFYESIKDFKNIKDILILGAGGTARAISVFLRQKGFNVDILNRSKHRLAFFEKQNFNVFSWDDFKICKYDLVVNTTSAGLSSDILPIKADTLQKLFKKAKYAVDVIYNKKTPFLKDAKEAELTTKDGSDMLLYQAVLAFEIFFDNKYNKKDIKQYMQEAFKLFS